MLLAAAAACASTGGAGAAAGPPAPARADSAAAAPMPADVPPEPAAAVRAGGGTPPAPADSAFQPGPAASADPAFQPAPAVGVGDPALAPPAADSASSPAKAASDSTVGPPPGFVRSEPDGAPPGLAAPAVRRIPLLPWPFYGRRSLAALGPEGVAALPAGSPEHRLLDALEVRECGSRGEPPPTRCLFLEGGTVYAIEREPGSRPARFLLQRLELRPEAFDDGGAADVRVDRSDPERPLLVVRSSPGGGRE